MMEVTINKHRLTGNFTQTDNRIIEDTRLSCEAYKLLTWILHSHPKKEHCFDEWQEVIHTGIRKLKKVLGELETYGYMKQIQKRNKYGQFMRTEYLFFDSPSQEDFTVCPKPSDGSGKDTLYNTPCNIPVVLSCLSHPETEQKDFPTEIVETVEDSESNESLTDCIKRNIEQITAEKPELKEKVSRLEMPVFVTYLVGVLQNALQTLKHPEAKGKFIKSVILHKINEFKAKKSVPTPKPEKKTIPIVDEKKSERQAFTSWLKERMDFEGNLQENDTEYCHFLISVADALTELVFTNRAGKRVVDGYELREGLSQIDRIDGELEEFANEFFHYFKRLLEMKADSGDVVRDIKRYMTAVLPDFVKRYSAGNILPTYNGEEMGGFRYQKHSLTSEQVARVNEYLQLVNRFDEMPPATYRSILLGLSDEKQKYYLSRIPKERFDKEVPAGQPLTEKTLEDFVTMAEYLIVQEQATGIPMIW